MKQTIYPKSESIQTHPHRIQVSKKERLSKILIAALTVFLFAFGCVLPAGAEVVGCDGTHTEPEWKPIGSGTNLTLTNDLPEGKYYLIDDILLASQWKPENNVTLCLNGHTIAGSISKSLIQVGYYDGFNTLIPIRLTVTDCKDNGKITNANGRGVEVLSTFNMYGGSIIGNIAEEDGGGVFVYRDTFNMHGGSITGNSAKADGGGVYVGTSGTFNVMDKITIIDNEKGIEPKEKSNVYLSGTMTLQGNLDGDSRIGITTRIKPQTDNPVEAVVLNSVTYTLANFFPDIGEDANRIYLIEEDSTNPHLSLYYVAKNLYPVNTTDNIGGNITVTDTGEYTSTDKAIVGSTITFTVMPKEGYMFETTPTVTANADSSSVPVIEKGNNVYEFTMPDSAVTISADFVAKPYTLTFKDADTILTTITQNVDSTISPDDIPNPTKEGHTFNGWMAEDSTLYEIPETMPAEDRELTALFAVNQYTITLKDSEGAVLKTITEDYNTTIPQQPSPTKTGYTFVEWQKEDGTPYVIPSTMPAENVTVTADFVINHTTITFKDSDGRVIKTISGNYNTSISPTEIPTPTKRGYTFNGWQSEGGKPYTIPSTMPAESITVTAVWKSNPSSPSTSGGQSSWLTETPTPTPTATPTPSDTVPTDVPVTQPTEIPTNLAPILGVLAGLGCAVAVLRRR